MRSSSLVFLFLPAPSGFGANLRDRWPRSQLAATRVTETILSSSQAPRRPEPHEQSLTQCRSQPEKEKLSDANDQLSQDENPGSQIDDEQISNRGEIAPATLIRGVRIPARPRAPGPEDCCMSGCARCVYDLYSEDLQEYQANLEEARSQLTALSLTRAEWDETLLGQYPDASTDSKPSGKSRLEPDIDPSIKAFLALEQSLKK